MTPKKLKDAQLRLGLTNAAMADLLCVTVSYVEMLRGGETNSQQNNRAGY